MGLVLLNLVSVLASYPFPLSKRQRELEVIVLESLNIGPARRELLSGTRGYFTSQLLSNPSALCLMLALSLKLACPYLPCSVVIYGVVTSVYHLVTTLMQTMLIASWKKTNGEQKKQNLERVYGTIRPVFLFMIHLCEMAIPIELVFRVIHFHQKMYFAVIPIVISIHLFLSNASLSAPVFILSLALPSKFILPIKKYSNICISQAAFIIDYHAKVVRLLHGASVSPTDEEPR